MESLQFPSAYAVISGPLDDLDNLTQQNFELFYNTKNILISLFGKNNFATESTCLIGKYAL